MLVGFRKAGFLPQLELLGIRYTEHIDDLSLSNDHHSILTTYETLLLNLDAFLGIEWHVAVFEEGHRLRNPKSEAAVAAVRLAARQKIVVSGTPMQNRPDDLWSLMNICVPGLLRHYAWFRDQFIKPLRDGRAIETGLARERMQLLGKITAPFILERTNDEVGNKRSKVPLQIEYIDMGPEQQSAYEVIRSSMDTRVREAISRSGLAKSQLTILAAINRLRQISCHPKLLKQPELDRISSAKIEFLLNCVPDLVEQGKQVIITSEWAQFLHLIAEALEEVGIAHTFLHGQLSDKKREKAESDFRTGVVPVFLMTLKVGGEGLDLPEADVMIIAGPWWNPKVIEQAIGRMTRDEREKDLLAMLLVCRGVEEGVLKIANAKGEMIDAVKSGAAAGRLLFTAEDVAGFFAPVTYD